MSRHSMRYGWVCLSAQCCSFCRSSPPARF